MLAHLELSQDAAIGLVLLALDEYHRERVKFEEQVRNRGAVDTDDREERLVLDHCEERIGYVSAFVCYCERAGLPTEALKSCMDWTDRKVNEATMECDKLFGVKALENQSKAAALNRAHGITVAQRTSKDVLRSHTIFWVHCKCATLAQQYPMAADDLEVLKEQLATISSEVITPRDSRKEALLSAMKPLEEANQRVEAAQEVADISDRHEQDLLAAHAVRRCVQEW